MSKNTAPIINDETIKVPAPKTLTRFVKELDPSIKYLILHDRLNHIIVRTDPAHAVHRCPRTKVLNYFEKDKETLDVFLKI